MAIRARGARNVGASNFFRLALSLAASGPAMFGAAMAAEKAPAAPKLDSAGEQEIVVVGQQNKAVAAAPMQSAINATEPQAVISGEFIQQFQPRTADFMSLLQLTPSAGGTTSANGPGLGEAKTTLRGFKDGEFNITFDGIPFGDTNNPTHHSTSFFPAADIGGITVERGPGNASNLGQASFGGTVMLRSVDLEDKMGGYGQLTFGTWSTINAVTQFQTGTMMADTAPTRAMVSFHEISSDGNLTYSPIRGYDQMAKADSYLGGVHLTFLLTHDWNSYYQPDSAGITNAQLAANGKNYALSNDPTAPNFKNYNYTEKQTWFSYLRAEAQLSETISVDNTAYYYYYDNSTLSATDATGLTANLVQLSPTSSTKTAGIPGYDKLNHYSVYGDIAKVHADLGVGTLTAGVWWETASTERHQILQNLLTGAPNYANSTAPKDITYLQNSGWDQYQPFAEFAWNVTPKLTITPGVKYISFRREVDAPVNQTSRVETHYGHTATSTLPYFTANYLLQDNWSVYFQYAQGWLAQDLNTTYVQNPTKNSVEPQTSTNYQIGTVFRTGRFLFDADYYKIDFKNKAVSVGTGADQHFENIGGATYEGFEAQGSYVVGPWAFYANGSSNSAEDNATGLQIANAPKWTTAVGLLYRNGPLKAGLTDKMVGTQYAVAGELGKIDPIETLDFNASYQVGIAQFQLGVYNIQDNQNLISMSSIDPVKQRLQFLAGRSVQAGVKIAF